MKILLQGYLQDANFGDNLYAHLFYERCVKLGFEEIDFLDFKGYGIGSFCREEIGYTARKKITEQLRADAFVLISGGSLWNDKNRSGDAKIRYRRFILPARLFQLRCKPVYALGCGGGPVDTPWLRREMTRMLKRAKVVTFRDAGTKDVFDSYGVKHSRVTADTALVLTRDMVPELAEKNAIEKAAGGRKKLLLHIPDGPECCKYVADLIVPGLLSFLAEHPEYCVVLSHDNIRHIGKLETQEIQRIKDALTDANVDYYEYRYHDVMQMCALIGEMDCVITCKLHVGVAACSLDKSVLAFPVHREKTDNFYRMIGESGRCVNVRGLDSRKAHDQLTTYHDKPVHIPDELRSRAEENLAVLDEIARMDRSKRARAKGS